MFYVSSFLEMVCFTFETLPVFGVSSTTTGELARYFWSAHIDDTR